MTPDTPDMGSLARRGAISPNYTGEVEFHPNVSSLSGFSDLLIPDMQMGVAKIDAFLTTCWRALSHLPERL